MRFEDVTRFFVFRMDIHCRNTTHTGGEEWISRKPIALYHYFYHNYRDFKIVSRWTSLMWLKVSFRTVESQTGHYSIEEKKIWKMNTLKRYWKSRNARLHQSFKYPISVNSAPQSPYSLHLFLSPTIHSPLRESSPHNNRTLPPTRFNFIKKIPYVQNPQNSSTICLRSAFPNQSIHLRFRFLGGHAHY